MVYVKFAQDIENITGKKKKKRIHHKGGCFFELFFWELGRRLTKQEMVTLGEQMDGNKMNYNEWLEEETNLF